MAWEQERIGDPSAPWLGEVRDVIKESVPEPRKDEFTLESTSTRKVIRIGEILGLTKLLIFGGRYLTRGRVQEYTSNREQTPRHSLVVYERQNVINSKARSIFQRKSAPDHLFKYHLQVVYFVSVKTNKSSPREVWLCGTRAAR